MLRKTEAAEKLPKTGAPQNARLTIFGAAARTHHGPNGPDDRTLSKVVPPGIHGLAGCSCEPISS
jgi:hypothetical protein